MTLSIYKYIASLPQKEIGENLNHVGSITETHQELIQPNSVLYFSSYYPEFSISILQEDPINNPLFLTFVGNTADFAKGR